MTGRACGHRDRVRSSILLAVVLAGSACDDGEPSAGECPGGARQVVDGGEVALTEASAPSLAGDHVVMLAGAPATAFAVDACTGEATALAGEGLSGAFALTSELGALALGHRQPSGEVLLLDRLDEPGVDEPRVIATLDPIDSGWFRWPDGLLLWSGPLMRDAPGTSRIFAYPGADGPTGAATLVAEDVVWLARGGLDVFVARTASGELLHVHAGAATRVHPHVRSAGMAPDGAQVVWQAAAGGWTLRTLATGVDVQLGAIDAAKIRSAGPDAASWRWTDDAVAAIDADGVLVAAHDRETGARLGLPPPHLAARDDVPGPLLFVTAQVTPERVELAWDPRTGELTEWYRGPDVMLVPQRADDAGVRYLADPGLLWLHRSEGGPALLQAEASLDAIPLADGRTLMGLVNPDETRRLVLLDRTGAHARELADGVSRWSLTADDPPRLAYAIADEPDAGVWIVPISPVSPASISPTDLR